MKIKLQHGIALTCCALMAACATPGKAPSPSATPAPTTTKMPAPKAGVLVIGRSSKAIIEDIVSYRSSKGMKILVRTPTYIEFSSAIGKANIPTEARIQYTLSSSAQGWVLSAKVLQISYPGTKKEKIEEITAHVQDKLNEELARYATN
ncbi:hypothetical protein [Chitinibacter sp. GC72]|uniref:hypothetical protein n=1 Tax=Chitinibacter sp. GC72 TaxID=1526917 RepID=UPI0012F94D76|nr:hypothetical protein [Chitinibacter sp. GC72]